MDKRAIVIYLDDYSDARYMANKIYRPAMDVDLKLCEESEWYKHIATIRIEQNDCIVVIAKGV